MIISLGDPCTWPEGAWLDKGEHGARDRVFCPAHVRVKTCSLDNFDQWVWIWTRSLFEGEEWK